MTSSAKTKKTINKLPPNPFIFEILDLVSKQRSRAKKIDVLKEYSTDSLKAILIWNYDETVISLLPDGEVPFEKNDVPLGTDHTSLRKEWKNLYHFVKGGNDSLSKTRRETMFIQILEGLHPQEANILILIKDKILESEYKITKPIVEAAFPDIQWGGRC
jgi:hypothetical protein